LPWGGAPNGYGTGLSHESAAGLWQIHRQRRREIEVSVPAPRDPRPSGIRVHQRIVLGGEDVGTHRGIPVTSPFRTVLDLAIHLPELQLEAAVNEADKLDLIDPETLRAGIERPPHQPGVGKLRELLDRRTFTLADTELERRFLRIARRTGLPPPLTQQWVNSFRVDFYLA
jgi:AbiEi antitoxin C-terminal domain